MNRTLMVKYAVSCLEELETPKTPQEVSRAVRIPLEKCEQILVRFEAAGLIRKNARSQFECTRSIEDFTAFEVLKAIWSSPFEKVCQMIYEAYGLMSAQVTRLAAQVATWPRG